MFQQIRDIFRRFRATAVTVMAAAWLTFGIAPCLMAAPADHHGDHDCPHCAVEIVVVAPACDVPADIVSPTQPSPDWQPALPVNGLMPATRVARFEYPPPLPIAPHERPIRHRYCRLLE